MIVALVMLFGIALFLPQSATSSLRGIFHTALWPMEKASSSVAASVRDFSEFFLSIGDLKRENERLSEDNIRLSTESAALAFLREENESLRRDAGLEARKKFDLIAVEVIALGGESQRGAAVIDRGSMHGVEADMPVIVGDGLLVGVVDEVYLASARVSFLTSSKMTLGGITAENGSKGIVRGDRGLGILFGMVAQSDALREGDRIMTSGIGGTFPSGLYVGSVGSTRDSDDKLFREASVVSPVDFDSLRFLFLVRKDIRKTP